VLLALLPQPVTTSAVTASSVPPASTGFHVL
jgi:hypothetical protein